MAARCQRSPILNTCESPPASQERNEVQLPASFAALATLAENEKNKYAAGNAEIPAQHLVWIPRNSQSAPQHLLEWLAMKRIRNAE